MALNPLSARERQKAANPYVARRRYIDLTSYLPSSDLEDCWDGAQAAFNEAQNREVVVTMDLQRSRRFRFLNAAKGSLVLPHSAKVIWEPGAVFDFSGYGKDRSGVGINYMQREAARIVTISVPASVPSGAKFIDLIVPPGEAPAMPLGYALLQSTDLFTTMEGALGTRGEWVYIVKSTPGRLTFASEVLDNYLTTAGNVTLAWFDMPKLHFENMQILGAGILNDVDGVPKLGDRPVRLFQCKDTIFDGGDIQYCDNGGPNLVSCPRGTIRDMSVTFDDLPARDRNQYGVTHSGTCEDWTVSNSRVFGGKEAFALSSTGGSGEWYYRQGITRRIKYTGNLAKGAWRSGFCTHHNHERIDWFQNIAEDCEQGIDIRIQNAVAQGNIFRRMGRGGGSLDCGVQLASGSSKVRLEGNLYEDCLRGVYTGQAMQHERTPGDYVIRNETMRGERLIYGVDLAHAGSTVVPLDAQLGTVTIEGMDFAGRTEAGSGVVGVRLRGKWNIPKVQGRFKGGTGASGVVSMTRSTGSAAADGGPISPMLDIEYTAGYVAPVIQFATGVTKQKLTGIGFNAPGE